jgi:hypothetical protein
MTGQYLLIDRMDIAHDEEGTFGEHYHRHLLPGLLKVSGVRHAVRYRNPEPTSPRYATLFEIDNPAVVKSAQWAAALESGGWPRDLLPRTMNRHQALYSRIGGKADLTYSTRHLFCVMLDVEPHVETLLNQLYDEEHMPLLLALPGVRNVVRHKTDTSGHPAYIAIYEIEQAGIPSSQAWITASDTGRWKPEVRPYTYNKRFILYDRIDG